jgi:hypothetical protein
VSQRIHLHFHVGAEVCYPQHWPWERRPYMSRISCAPFEAHVARACIALKDTYMVHASNYTPSVLLGYQIETSTYRSMIAYSPHLESPQPRKSSPSFASSTHRSPLTDAGLRHLADIPLYACAGPHQTRRLARTEGLLWIRCGNSRASA